jgi:UDP-GlcNAc:undecaprenyl-phosphate/decaprenyl-phosphate GlcNAc-1-phosphate transferase
MSFLSSSFSPAFLPQIFLPLFPLLVTYLVVPHFNSLAGVTRLVDVPGGHKRHKVETPLVGGPAMACVVLATLALLSSSGRISWEWWEIIAPAVFLAVMGIADDLHRLSVRARFVGQVLAALLLVQLSGAAVVDLGDLAGVGSIDLRLLAVPFTVFAVVGAINAVNMSDGMDGLAGGLVGVSFVTLTIAAAIAGMANETVLLLVLTGAVTGFLLFNARLFGRARALLFMGDSGSMFLGFMLAYFLIVLAQGPGRAMSPVVALWIFGIPLIDALNTIVRRFKLGKSPFHADNEHLHHILERAGFSVNQTLGLIVSGHALLCAVGLGAYYANVPDYFLFAGFAVVALGYFAGMAYARRVGTRAV